MRIQSDLRFDYEFVKNLIEDTENIDIDIFKEDNQIESSQFQIL